MDSLTQAILGAAVGEASLGKTEGNKAILWGAVLGTIPDLDVFAANFYDPVKSLLVHRGFSHSILFTLLISPFAGYLLKKIYKKSDTSLKGWITMSILVIGTHILLDLFTTYGTGLFEPFSHYRVEWSTISIIDIFYTLPFFISVALVLFFKRTSNTRRIINRAGLVISTTYLLLTIPNKFYIQNKFEKNLKISDISYFRIKTVSLPLTNFLWMGIAQQEEGFYIGYYSNFDGNKPIHFEYISRNDSLLHNLPDPNKINNLKRFSKGYYSARIIQDEIIFSDMRFGRMGMDKNSPFVFSFRLKKNGDTLEVKENTIDSPAGEDFFAGYIKRIFGK